jgi:hypothetical protein
MLFYITSFATSFSIVANRKTIQMLPIVWANLFDHSSWPSKLFKENTIEGVRTLLVPIGGGKSPPCTENEMLRR